LLKSAIAFEPYTSSIPPRSGRRRSAEFLLFDPEFPISIRYSVDRMTDAWPGGARGRRRPDARRWERLAGPPESQRGFGQIDD